MKDATLPLKIIFHYLVLYLTFFSYFYSPAFLQAACDCIDPGLGDCSSLTPGDPCPRQPGTGCADTPANQYFLRYSVTAEHGFMTFIGNSLGLNKAPCVNDVGSIPGNITHSIGAFITTDPTQQVGSYAHILNGDTGGPAYTTLDWTKNRSTAELHLPAGAVILYAELIWCGSYGFYCGNPNVGSTYGVCVECILNYADGPIVFITPDNVTHSVTADPTTAIKSQNSVSSLDYCAGHYVRTQNVTAILTVLADHNGTYTVGNVPATISPFENSSNGAGWTLAIVYHDPSTTNVNNMTLFVGGQASSLSATPAEITGFCAQYDPDPSKRLPARLLVSAIEGDPNLTGDQMQFGPTPATLQPLSGPNNPIGDFFCSQINDDNGNLINTTGTFCTYNSTTSTLLPNGRQGYDITNVDCSGTIVPGQTTAYAVGTTTGDNYVINALGLQLSVYAPYMTATKAVDSDCAKHDDTVTFTITIENSGTLDASDLVLTDVLELGLTFVPNSVYVNSGNVPGADPNVGVPMGALAQGDTTEVTFDAQITGLPLSGNQFVNRGTVSFDYIPACGGDPVTEDTDTNEVFITLDSPAVLTAAKLINGVLDYCAAPGETVTISISVENTGPIDTTGLVLTDILESGLTFVPNSVYVNSVNIPGANPNAGVSLGTLAQGNTTVVTFQAHNVSLPPSGNQFLNTGSVSFDYIPLCGGVTPVPGSADTNDSFITLNSPAVLTATKLVNGVLDYCAVPGETVTISVSVENTGRLDTTDLAFTDILESGLTFVADSVYVNSVNVPGADPSVGVDLGDLAQGNTTVVTFQAQNVSLPPSGNQFVNTGTVSFYYRPACGGVDPVQISTDTNEAYITLNSPAVLTATKLVNDVIHYGANIGDILTFTITVENSGRLDVDHLFLTDILESGLTFIDDSVYVNSVNIPGVDPTSIPLPSLAQNHSTVVEFQVQIVSPPPSGNQFVNYGSVSYDYIPACGGVGPIPGSTDTNEVFIRLRSTAFPPPRSFSGIGRKCEFLNKTMYRLTATWRVPVLPTCTGYQVFVNGILQTTIPAAGPFVFQTCLASKQDGREVTIVALYPNNYESPPLHIQITYE